MTHHRGTEDLIGSVDVRAGVSETAPHPGSASRRGVHPMRASRHVVALSLTALAMAGCRGNPSPWARKLTHDEARAWPTRCGIPLEAIKRMEGKKDADDVYEGSWENPNGPAGALLLGCAVFWPRAKHRPAAFHGRVRIGGIHRTADTLSEAEIRPVVEALAAELPPSEQAVVWEAARRDEQTTDHGAFTYSGGYAPGRRIWSLIVTER